MESDSSDQGPLPLLYHIQHMNRHCRTERKHPWEGQGFRGKLPKERGREARKGLYLSEKSNLASERKTAGESSRLTAKECGRRREMRRGKKSCKGSVLVHPKDALNQNRQEYSFRDSKKE